MRLGYEGVDALLGSSRGVILGEIFLSLLLTVVLLLLLRIAALWVSNYFIRSAKHVSRETKLVKSNSSLFLRMNRIEFGKTRIADSFFMC